MAYSTALPPSCVVQSMAGPSIWHHTSADAAAVADGAGFISNGGNLGMKVNDIVYHKDSTSVAAALTVHKVVSVSATAPGAVDLSDGIVVGSATNTD